MSYWPSPYFGPKGTGVPIPGSSCPMVIELDVPVMTVGIKREEMIVVTVIPILGIEIDLQPDTGDVEVDPRHVMEVRPR